jgi:hypothetical protein
MRENSQGYNGAAVTNELNEFGLGTNWHPTKLPSLVNEFIPYLHLTFNIGTVKGTYKAGSNAGVPDSAANGSTSGFSFGGGYKFYTFKGFGARMLVDYYMRTEKYKEDTVGDIFNKNVAGPRLMLAISYRF